MATTKQKKLAKKVSENIRTEGKNVKPMGELMIESGYSESASKRPSIVTQSEGFKKLLVKAGLSDEVLTEKLYEGLNATKVISCNVIAKDGEGMKDANNMTKDFIDIEDYNVRHKYLMTVLELKGLVARNGFSLQIGDRNTKIDVKAQKIMIVRSPNHRPLDDIETVDVKMEDEDGKNDI